MTVNQRNLELRANAVRTAELKRLTADVAALQRGMRDLRKTNVEAYLSHVGVRPEFRQFVERVYLSSGPAAADAELASLGRTATIRSNEPAVRLAREFQTRLDEYRRTNPTVREFDAVVAVQQRYPAQYRAWERSGANP